MELEKHESLPTTIPAKFQKCTSPRLQGEQSLARCMCVVFTNITLPLPQAGVQVATMFPELAGSARIVVLGPLLMNSMLSMNVLFYSRCGNSMLPCLLQRQTLCGPFLVRGITCKCSPSYLIVLIISTFDQVFLTHAIRLVGWLNPKP